MQARPHTGPHNSPSTTLPSMHRRLSSSDTTSRAGCISMAIPCFPAAIRRWCPLTRLVECHRPISPPPRRRRLLLARRGWLNRPLCCTRLLCSSDSNQPASTLAVTATLCCRRCRGPRPMHQPTAPTRIRYRCPPLLPQVDSAVSTAPRPLSCSTATGRTLQPLSPSHRRLQCKRRRWMRRTTRRPRRGCMRSTGSSRGCGRRAGATRADSIVNSRIRQTARTRTRERRG